MKLQAASCVSASTSKKKDCPGTHHPRSFLKVIPSVKFFTGINQSDQSREYAISSSTPKKPVSNRERKNIQISQTIFVVCASVLLKLFMDIYLLKAPLANFQMNEG